MPTAKTTFTEFSGGLVTDVPPLTARPGTLRAGQNVYIDNNGGYATFSGYERFSGQTKPSSASYAVLPVTITGAVSVGNTVTDNSGAASGVVIQNNITELILTKLVGNFAVGNIKVGAVVVGTCSATQSPQGAETALLNAQYTALAADNYRADIGAVPGSGSILGVGYLNDVAYAWRNNAGETAAVMHKSTLAGWEEVPLGRELNFTSGGTTQIQDGDTVTGAVSGATATIGRVALQSGSWAGGDAVGKLVFQEQTGTFQAENLDIGASLNVATIAGNSSAITLAINGRYEIKNANFSGNAESIKMYGVDGKNRGFEFDGTNYVPIETGISTFPSHLEEHKYHLFYSFNSSVQHSGPGTPYQWTLLTGGDELALSDKVTGFAVQPGDVSTAALGITTRNSLAMLYGTSSADWNLSLYKRGAGGIEWTVQNVGNTYMLDDRGIASLATSQNYGNFEDATSSQAFQRWFRTKKTQVSSSFVSGDRNLYAIFFNDKTGMISTVDNGVFVGAIPALLPVVMKCVITTEDASGNELILFGGNDGYVYELFQGTSFDGSDIEWYFDTSFDFLQSPTVMKRFTKATVEVIGDGYNQIAFTATIGYGNPDLPQPEPASQEIVLSNAIWDVGVWDVGTWDGQTLSPFAFRLMGLGENVSLRLYGLSSYGAQLFFSGCLLQYILLKDIK